MFTEHSYVLAARTRDTSFHLHLSYVVRYPAPHSTNEGMGLGVVVPMWFSQDYT